MNPLSGMPTISLTRELGDFAAPLGKGPSMRFSSRFASYYGHDAPCRAGKQHDGIGSDPGNHRYALA